mmetsp:Transcript_50766/g.164172  ORF Transcript_50766/g.164172 Transcript_50766/m.164172 type:complete len:186 (+) Transcript_50766:190-747(+)
MFKCVACCNEASKDDVVIAEPQSAFGFGLPKDAELVPLAQGAPESRVQTTPAAPESPPPKVESKIEDETPTKEPPKEASVAPRSDLKSWHFTVTVTKGDGANKIGLDTVARQTHFEGPSLKIKKLKEGLMQLYNNIQEDEVKKIAIGDFIVEVNGARGNTDELYKVINSNEVLNIVISRPPKSDQ